jgi:hypothetical protein
MFKGLQVVLYISLLSVMVFELILIGIKLVLEKVLVDLLWLYHTSLNIPLIRSDESYIA